MNAVSGQPVARALVSLDEDHAMLTGSDGEFSFDNVAAGEYYVSVQKPGYSGFGGIAGMGVMTIRYSMGGRRVQSAPPRRIQVGPDMPALTFAITPLAMITGHITLSTADPADGIQVQVYGRQSRNGHARWSMEGQTRTRSDGSFRIPNLSLRHLHRHHPGFSRPATGRATTIEPRSGVIRRSIIPASPKFPEPACSRSLRASRPKPTSL